jgi:hypothetical protein
MTPTHCIREHVAYRLFLDGLSIDKISKTTFLSKDEVMKSVEARFGERNRMDAPELFVYGVQFTGRSTGKAHEWGTQSGVEPK